MNAPEAYRQALLQKFAQVKHASLHAVGKGSGAAGSSYPADGVPLLRTLQEFEVRGSSGAAADGGEVATADRKGAGKSGKLQRV